MHSPRCPPSTPALIRFTGQQDVMSSGRKDGRKEIYASDRRYDEHDDKDEEVSMACGSCHLSFACNLTSGYFITY